jgi:class 3 adenylate cyclase
MRLPLSMVTGIVAEVSRGLSATHRAGIIHRDVKPANVFLAQEGGREIAKLLDFGVATLVAQTNAARSAHDVLDHWVGTPQYVSPEQLEGEPMDGRSDLWSLAVMTYRMLTGQCPFRASTLPALTEQICSASYEPASALAPHLDARADAFFARALARKPGDRLQSAEDFAAALHALGKTETPATRILFLDDEPDMELLLRQRFRHQVREGRYELHFATDGRGGLDELRRRPNIDVVLTDLNMPGMDGLTFLGQVPDVNPFVRVVVVSAYGDMTNIRTAMNRGAFDFLGKPIDFDDLQATIEKCAAHVSVVRKALQSTEENQMMRVLLGQGVAERWLNALRNADSLSHQITRATVAFVDVHGFARTLSDPLPSNVFERLNEYFALFLRELGARDGKVSRFIGDAVLAIFEGEDHLRRALDACLAIRVRLHAQAAQSQLDRALALGVCIGLDSGSILSGPAGSLAMGHVEPSLLGETVSTAARLQALAGKDELLVSASALRIIAGDYQCEEDAERSIVTRAGPLTVARVIRKRCSASAPSLTEETREAHVYAPDAAADDHPHPDQTPRE